MCSPRTVPGRARQALARWEKQVVVRRDRWSLSLGAVSRQFSLLTLDLKIAKESQAPVAGNLLARDFVAEELPSPASPGDQGAVVLQPEPPKRGTFALLLGGQAGKRWCRPPDAGEVESRRGSPHGYVAGASR